MANQLFEELRAAYAAARREKDSGNYVEAYHKYVEVFRLTNRSADDFGELTQDELSWACAVSEEAAYKMALTYYAAGEKQQAAQFLEDAETELYKGKVLLGICSAHCQLTLELFRTMIIPNLLIVTQQEAQLLQEEIDELDDAMLSEAYRLLAGFYLAGAPGLTEVGPEKAKQVLERGLRVIKGDAARKSLMEKLSHYKTGFFGKVEYVE